MSTGDGLLAQLIQAGTITTLFGLAGSAIAWLFTRRDARRAEQQSAEDRDEEELREERQFLDERARKDMARIEGERDAARAECRAANDRVERLLRELWDIKAEAIGLFMLLMQLRDLVVRLHASPPAAGTPPPPFDTPPDPRRRATPG